MSRPASISRIPPPSIGSRQSPNQSVNRREAHVFDEEDLVSPSSSYTLGASPVTIDRSINQSNQNRGRQALRLDLIDDDDDDEDTASPKRKPVPNSHQNNRLVNQSTNQPINQYNKPTQSQPVPIKPTIQPYKPFLQSTPPSIIPGARPSAPITISRNNQINRPATQASKQPIAQLGQSYDSEFDDTFERDLIDLEDEEAGESQSETDRRERHQPHNQSSNQIQKNIQTAKNNQLIKNNQTIKNKSVFDSPPVLSDFPSDHGTDADDQYDDRADEERDDITSGVLEINQSNTQSLNHIINSNNQSTNQSVKQTNKQSTSTPPRRSSSILQLTRINSPPERVSHPSSRTQTSLITPAVRSIDLVDSAQDDEDFDDGNVTVLNALERRRSLRNGADEDEDEPNMTETDRDGTQDESHQSSEQSTESSDGLTDSEPESTDPSPVAAIPVTATDKRVSRNITPTMPSRSPSPPIERSALSRAISSQSANRSNNQRRTDDDDDVDEQLGDEIEEEDQDDDVSQLVLQRRRERDKEKLAAMKEKHRSQRGTPHVAKESDSPPKESASVSNKAKKSASHKGLRKKRGNMDEISYDDLVFGAQIGSGSYGEVFKGELWRQEVAIKRIRINESLSRSEAETIMKEFRREVRIMRHLRHPNVLEYLGVCETTHSLCLITEYCAAGSLEDQLTMLRNDGRRMRTARAVNLALDIARGLNWLFHKGIIHRDLKTANVLIDNSGRAKLADFGLSHVRRSADGSLKLRGRAGTPSYSAPEVLTGAEYGTAADIFSYGIVLNEMLSGEPPYLSTPLNCLPLADFEAAVIAGSRPTLAKSRPSLQSLITECWSDDPPLRPDVESIIARLELALVETNNPNTDTQTAEAEPPSIDDVLDQTALKQKLELDYARLLSVQAQIAAQEKRLAQVNEQMLVRGNSEHHTRNQLVAAGDRSVQ